MSELGGKKIAVNAILGIKLFMSLSKLIMRNRRRSTTILEKINSLL
jgi:hypothetical protein